MKAVHLLTIGSFNRDVAENLAAQLSRRLAVPCRLLNSSFQIDAPRLLDRDQLDADSLLARLEAHEQVPDTILIGLTEEDIATLIFTFVFGKARRGGHAALVSLARLRPEFYGLPAAAPVMRRRAISEMLHELGHLAGIEHCSDHRCLMHFAMNVESIDLRGDAFCRECSGRLPPGLLAAGP